MIFLSVSTIGSVFGVSNFAEAGRTGGSGRRGSISGNCAVLYAHAASTWAPWLISSFQTLSNVSDWLWCVLKYSAISCAHQKPGIPTSSNDRLSVPYSRAVVDEVGI